MSRRAGPPARGRRRGPSRLIVAFSVARVAGLLATDPAAQTRGARAATGRPADRLGVWAGQRTAEGEARGDAVEPIVARDPGHFAIVALVTFIDGGLADTVRRQGRLTRQGAFFDLVGGGAMVLTLEPDGRLRGEFAGGPDLPVRFGQLELTRRG